MEYSHSCIKCKTKYQDNDPDAYLCATCKEERKAIAARVDATIGSRPRKNIVSPLQEYDNAPKVRGFMVLKSGDL